MNGRYAIINDVIVFKDVEGGITGVVVMIPRYKFPEVNLREYKRVVSKANLYCWTDHDRYTVVYCDKEIGEEEARAVLKKLYDKPI